MSSSLVCLVALVMLASGIVLIAFHHRERDASARFVWGVVLTSLGGGVLVLAALYAYGNAIAIQ